MNHVITIELPEDVFQPLAQAAARMGKTPGQLALSHLQDLAVAERQRAEGLARLMRHAGAVDLGYPTGLDNESIDADLADEYGSAHEDRP